jgi:HK97 family phage portal protein
VQVCVQAISTDLAGLPLIAVRGEGENQIEITEHWLLTLLKQPHPKTPGRKFRKQLIADLTANGNAFVRIWRDFSGQAIQLARIVPNAVSPVVTNHGEILAWKVGNETLAWEDVLHIGDFSTRMDEHVVFGDSPIEALALALQVDLDARKQAGRAARRGRLEVIGTPRDAGVIMGPEKLRAVTDSYTGATETGAGLWVANYGLEITPVTYTPKEADFMEQGKATKNEILASFGVPGVRAGDASANYGTARQQMKTYWEGLMGRAAIIDDALSTLAEEGLRIRHSFAKVEALQTSLTERLARAERWVLIFGMDPSEAARYEGFLDAPVPKGPYKPVGEPTSGGGGGAPRTDNGDPVPNQAQKNAPAREAILRALRESDADDNEGPEVLASRLVDTFNEYFGESYEEVARQSADTCYFGRELPSDVRAGVFGERHADFILEQIRGSSR